MDYKDVEVMSTNRRSELRVDTRNDPKSYGPEQTVYLQDPVCFPGIEFPNFSESLLSRVSSFSVVILKQTKFQNHRFSP